MPDATAATLDIAKLSPGIGAELRGLDLWRLDDAGFAALRDAFLRFKVLRIPGQRHDPLGHIGFSRRLGEVQIHVVDQYRHPDHPEIYEISNVDRATGKARGEHPDPGTLAWHTDLSFMARPALATILYGIAIPLEGGETEFCDLAAAWDALPEAEQRKLAGLRCVHDLAASRRRSGDIPLTAKQRAGAPPVEHPLVRTHPETGRQVLYLSSHIDYVVGMDAAASDALLARLVAHATQPARTYRHRWSSGDVMMWDNRCTMHRATAYDVSGERRIVQRTVVIGDVPV